MKVSLNWLKNYSDAAKNNMPSLDHLLTQLPMAGFEIDTIESVADDFLLDISITANRGDCLSVRGLSREIACLNHFVFDDWILSTKLHAWQQPTATGFVDIQAKDACTFYAGALIENITNTKPLPNWILDRLEKSGLDSINPIVDICNYVMLATGQPLHAFDAKAIHALQVRMAQAGETIQVLGGQTITLECNTLVIVDQQGVQAIAGIIGGTSSAVNENTTSIFLESAHFIPEAIAGRARQYGLQTEAAQRFERGVDPALPLLALNYATQLILEYLGGTLGVCHITHGNALPKPNVIGLREARIQRILGTPFAPHLIEQILPALGMLLEKMDETHWQVTPPSFRFDVQKEVDLIEELARVNGYDNIPTHTPQVKTLASAWPDDVLSCGTIILVNRGYFEIISYSFISETLQQQCFPDIAAVKLRNPISSELAMMRNSLWPSLLATLQYNVNRKQTRARYFEVARVYHPEWNQALGSVEQNLLLAGLTYGPLYPEQWGIKSVEGDFFDLKANIMAIFTELGIAARIRFVAAQNIMLQTGQCAEILLDDQVIGLAGRLHPRLQQYFELSKAVYLFEINSSKLPQKCIPTYHEMSRFPLVRRDFAFLVPRHEPIDDILSFVKSSVGGPCQEVILFDVYQGKNIPVEQKSIAFGVVLQDMHATLTDEQINHITTELVQGLSQKFSMQLRDS